MMDAICDPDVHTAVYMTSAQVGKTEILNNAIGYYIDQEPAPILLLQPTLQMASAWSKDRFAPMLRDTPELTGLVKEPRAKNSSNTMLHKGFPGGHITMAGANSPASLASRPVRIVGCDEVDRYPISVGSEGDPISLAKKRSETFWNRKLVLTSTPTVKGVSRIERAYEDSDQRRYYVPCPACKKMQTLEWRNVVWDQDKDGNHRPDTARIRCEYCDHAFSEQDRWEAVAQGEWRATKPFKGVAGFHISGLYSPWIDLETAVNDFLTAKHAGPEALMTFVNTFLGETWEEEGDAADEASLINRREEYPADVPAGALVLTAGVDVQDDRLEVEVVGWNQDEESWNIDYRVFVGDPDGNEVWEDLDDLILNTEYQHENGHTLAIAATGADSGAHTSSVYEYVKRRRIKRVFALKGMGGEGRPIIEATRKKRTGKERRPVPLTIVGVDDAKALVYSRFQVAKGNPGYCHFPVERDTEYFEGMTAEKRVTKFIKGYARREWRKIKPRNEPLDCRVYALAALRLLNPNWKALARRIGEPVPGAGSSRRGKVKAEPSKTEKPKRRRRRPVSIGS